MTYYRNYLDAWRHAVRAGIPASRIVNEGYSRWAVR